MRTAVKGQRPTLRDEAPSRTSVPGSLPTRLAATRDSALSGAVGGETFPAGLGERANHLTSSHGSHGSNPRLLVPQSPQPPPSRPSARRSLSYDVNPMVNAGPRTRGAITPSMSRSSSMSSVGGAPARQRSFQGEVGRAMSRMSRSSSMSSVIRAPTHQFGVRAPNVAWSASYSTAPPTPRAIPLQRARGIGGVSGGHDVCFDEDSLYGRPTGASSVAFNERPNTARARSTPLTRSSSFRLR